MGLSTIHHFLERKAGEFKLIDCYFIIFSTIFMDNNNFRELLKKKLIYDI